MDNISKKIDDTGKQFSDNTPLQNIKKAISSVKNDIKAIDIRIGVVSNTLLQLKLKERTKVLEDGKALEILDNEYEIEMWTAWAIDAKSRGMFSNWMFLIHLIPNWEPMWCGTC